MFKFISLIISLLIISLSNAEYTAKLPLESDKGGNLSNGSIKFINQNLGNTENWVPTSPIYTSWSNSGNVFGCTNWSPIVTDFSAGQSVTQTATDCQQQQTRTRQNREQETTSLAYRNVGAPITETQLISTIGTRLFQCEYDVSVANIYWWATWRGVHNGNNIVANGFAFDDVEIYSDPHFGNVEYSQYDYNGFRYIRGYKMRDTPSWGMSSDEGGVPVNGIDSDYTICKHPI